MDPVTPPAVSRGRWAAALFAAMAAALAAWAGAHAFVAVAAAAVPLLARFTSRAAALALHLAAAFGLAVATPVPGLLSLAAAVWSAAAVLLVLSLLLVVRPDLRSTAVPWRGVLVGVVAAAVPLAAFASPWADTVFASDVAARMQALLIATALLAFTWGWRGDGA